MIDRAVEFSEHMGLMSLSDSAYTRRFFSVYSQEEKDKVRGHAFYPSDYLSALLPEGVLHVQVVRSPHGNASFSKIDCSRAEKLSGVVKIITAKDIPNNLPIAGGRDKEAQKILSEKEVRFKGQPVALIVAESLSIARAAADLVEIDWKALEESGARVVEKLEFKKMHSKPSANLEYLSAEFKFPSLHARYLEPESGWVSLEGNRLNFQIGSLLSEAQRLWLSEVLEIPLSQIDAHEAYLGGQFGGRQQREMIAFLGVASWLTKKSCCLYLEYENQDVGSFGYSGELKIGFDRQSGKMKSLEGRIAADSGSYEGSAKSYLKKALEHAACVYDFEVIDLKGEVILTPSHPRRALKGEGVTAITWVTEQLIDRVAKVLEVPPIDFRLLHCSPSSAANLRVLEEMEKLERPFKLLTSERNRPLWDAKRIMGSGYSFQQFQSSDTKSIDELEVVVELHVSGSFSIRTINHTLDLHMKNALAGVAASVLKTHPKAFTVVGEMRPAFEKPRKRETYPEFYYLAQATWHSARLLREKIETVAKKLLRTDEVELKDGAAVNKLSDRKMGYRELAFTHGSHDLRSTYILKDIERPHGCSAGSVARVSIHPLTGELSVDSVKVVVDAGPVVRTTGLEIEAESAVAWAMAALFSSDLERNQPIPTPLDGPEEISLIPIEYPTQKFGDEVPEYFGARGVTDSIMSVVLSSLVTAIQNAKDKALNQIPMTNDFMYPEERPAPDNMIPFRRNN